MIVYCVFRTFKVDVEAGRGRGEGLTEEYPVLEAIFENEEDAKAFIKKHSPELRKRMHVEAWNAQ